MERLEAKLPLGTLVSGVVLVVSMAALAVYAVWDDGSWWQALFFAVVGGVGVFFIWSHWRWRVVFYEDRLVSRTLFDGTQTVRYDDLQAIVAVPAGSDIEFNLVGTGGETLATVDGGLRGAIEGMVMVSETGVPLIDVQEWVSEGKSLEEVLPTLTSLQRHAVDKLLDEQQEVDEAAKTNAPEDMAVVKKRLRVLGAVLALAALGGFFMLDGRVKLVPLVVVLAVDYGLYLYFYPRMYFETLSSKMEAVTYQLPWIGAVFSVWVLLSMLDMMNMDVWRYFAQVVVAGLVLFLPFWLKERWGMVAAQRFGRKAAVLVSMLLIAFAVMLPVNFLLTLTPPTHETVTVSDKHETDGRHAACYLTAEWRGESHDFEVSDEFYEETPVGAPARVCLRRSVLGLEYWTLHE